MAVMEAAIFEALWRHTAQIKNAKLWRVFKNIFATYLYRCLIRMTSNHFPQNKPNLLEEQPL